MRILIKNLIFILLAAITTQPSAVELASDGAGDLLFMPYYIARTVSVANDKYQSFFDIMNTSDDTVATLVNFREAQHGRLCASIKVILSPHDAWAAAIQETSDGVRLFSVDRSCTIPKMSATDNGAELMFTNQKFSKSRGLFIIDARDGGPETIDRCKEGFVEVIALGRSVAANSSTDGTIAQSAQHSDGVPADCDAVRRAFADTSTPPVHFNSAKTEFKEPTNTLKATYTLINFGSGIAYGGEFVALANFFSPDLVNGEGADGTSDEDLLFLPAFFTDPATLNKAKPRQSVVRISTGSKLETIVDTWNRGVDAVSAVLARSQAMNQWTTNTNLGAKTAWVITMPTSRFYTLTTPVPPFKQRFSANASVLTPLGLPSGGACNQVAIKLYDRHEALLAQRFNPANSGAFPVLCYAVNPIIFNGGNLMGSKLARNINSPATTKNGWMEIDFTPDSNRFFTGTGGLGRKASGPGSNDSDQVYAGLPVIAVSFTIRAKGAISTNYGTLWQHSYRRNIGPVFSIAIPPIDPGIFLPPVGLPFFPTLPVPVGP